MKKILVIFLCIMLSGCASSPRPIVAGSNVAGRKAPLKDLSENEKIKLFEQVSQEPVKDESDAFARELTLTALSRSVKRTGRISKNKFNRIDLRKIDTSELDHIYRVLNKKVYDSSTKEDQTPDYIDEEGNQFWEYDPDKGSVVTESEQRSNKVSVRKIMRLTALYSMGSELERRGTNIEFWKGFGATTSRATAMAVQLALTLAKYMI